MISTERGGIPGLRISNLMEGAIAETDIQDCKGHLFVVGFDLQSTFCQHPTMESRFLALRTKVHRE